MAKKKQMNKQNFCLQSINELLVSMQWDILISEELEGSLPSDSVVCLTDQQQFSINIIYTVNNLYEICMIMAYKPTAGNVKCQNRKRA